MGILVNKNSRVIIQGFTGKEGSFHAEQMIRYGTFLVGGVTPGKGGKKHLDRPVFNTVEQAVRETSADVSIILVPPAFAPDCIIEASYADIRIIVCITEGIPTKDMVMVKHYLKNKNTRLIGPNCPGIITVEETKVGIMPGFIFKKGKVGIVSKSGTLTYEVADQLVKFGHGISTAIGIGGDTIIGTTIKDILEFFTYDTDTEIIVMIGEIGGQLEVEASLWMKKNGNKKPVVGFIAGKTAPKGRIMGHAGAIVSDKYDKADTKIKILQECGIHVVNSPARIGKMVTEILKNSSSKCRVHDKNFLIL